MPIAFNILLRSTDTTAPHARLTGESYLKLKDFNKVITCMEYLVKNRYDDEHVYYSMAIALREIGQSSASIPWFELALKKAISKNINVYYAQLGQSCEETKDYQGAIKAYRKAYNYSHDSILLYHQVDFMRNTTRTKNKRLTIFDGT